MSRAKAFIATALAAETDDCILWPFSVGGHGYPNFRDVGRTVLATRHACEAAHGAPFAGADSAHICGVKRCINPRHLRWATRRENIADQDLHGVRRRGEQKPGAKLTAAAVVEIRKRHHTQAELADIYGVSPAAVQAVQDGRTWRHI